MLGGIHQVAQVVFVDGRGHDHAWYAAQVCQVEQAMMGHTVLADNAATVDAEGHRQALDSHVVDDRVITALQEGAVDGAEGAHAVLGKPPGKGHGVTLADAHVKGAARHGLEHERHRCAARHGGGNADNPVVLLCQFDQGLAEHVLIFQWTSLAA